MNKILATILALMIVIISSFILGVALEHARGIAKVEKTVQVYEREKECEYNGYHYKLSYDYAKGKYTEWCPSESLRK